MYKKIQQQVDRLEKRVAALEKAVRGNKAPSQTGSKKDKDLVLRIVNKIGECEESEAIVNKILDKKSMEGRILICFYISYKYFKNTWLTTGDLERITSELGVKIDVRNITNKIKELRQYLESGSVRKKGRPTSYRLNRKGSIRFEEILHG